MEEIRQYSVYKHFKGGLYQVLGFCKDSETLAELVIYQNLRDTSQIWTREINDFVARVQLDTGEVLNRFERVPTEQDLFNLGWQLVRVES
jgi:hypothetical protein